jgi:hypothetical protein
MASITLCPRCSSHLELPTGVAATTLVECPICEAEFLLASVAPRAVPKARVVEQSVSQVDAEAGVPSLQAGTSHVVNVGVDQEDRQSEASPPDSLSKLLRSSAEWQIPGIQTARDDEASVEDDEPLAAEQQEGSELEADDDRVIPNDHARPRSPFGATLDAAYRDADPQSAAPTADAPDELQLGGSRLDQLLSDLMKSPAASTSSVVESPTVQSEVGPQKPVFSEFSAGPAEISDETADEAASGAAAPSHDFGEVEELDAPEDRWQRLRDSTRQSEASGVELDESDETASESTHDEGQLEGLQLVTHPRRKRRRSVVRTLVGVVGGGAIGILGGAYALLWLRGPDGDVLQMANWVPRQLLPAAMQSDVGVGASQPAPFLPSKEPSALAADGNQEPADDSSSSLDVVDSPASQPENFSSPDENRTEMAAAPAAPSIVHDEAVTPASADEPIDASSAEPTAADVAAQPIVNEKHWPTTSIVGQLRNPHLYTVGELDELLLGADAAHRRFLAGDLSRKDDVAAMGQSYIELCKLAERFTLTNPSEFGNDLITKQITAKNIFRGVAGEPARRNDLAMIAGRWMQHPRRPNQGVVLLGKVTDLQARGEWTEYTVETPLGDSTAASKVLVEGLPFASGAEVAVVGVVVAEPRQAIAGYEGDAPQVIVSGFEFVPEVFVAPRVGSFSDDVAEMISGG